MLTLKRTYESPGRTMVLRHDVFDGDQCVGRILLAEQTPEGQRWFWTTAPVPQSTLDHGYAANREQAMTDFTARWDALHPRLLSKAQPIDLMSHRASGAISPHKQISFSADAKNAA
jgi:hypothetical protein